jgi:hypothetical protein
MCSTSGRLHLHLTEIPDRDGAQLPRSQSRFGISLPYGSSVYPFHERTFPIVVYHPDKEPSSVSRRKSDVSKPDLFFWERVAAFKSHKKGSAKG